MISEVAKSIENVLQNKLGKEEPKNVFREIFCKILGFKYDNSKILIEYSDEILDEDLTSIAKTAPKLGEPYHIIYGEMNKITKTARRKLVKELVNYFSYEEEGSFILILRDKKKNVWELITYARLLGRIQLRIFRVGPGESHRTTSENLAKLKLESADIGRSELAIKVEEAFNVLPVTQEFFDDYKRVMEHLVDYIRQIYRTELEAATPTGVNAQLFIHRSAKSFAHTLLNRLMFIMFLQKKGWIGGRKDFLRWIYEEMYDEDSHEFYRDFLRPLFLDILNRPAREKDELVDELNVPDLVKEIYKNISYYNGGLFSPLREFGVNLDEIITEFRGDNGREIIKEIMEFLHKYNFTVSEDSPFEVEVAVDPAMLGYIYESLIAEQERGYAGIFYTPKEEVDFMCRIALYNYLSKETEDRETLMKILFSEENVVIPQAVISVLDKIKIVDPACGSGAFLVGMFNVIREIYEKAGRRVNFDRKKDIIRKSLHGVDVKEWAVRVAEMRLWLALIEDEDEIPKDKPLLPNLTPNLRVGDSLVSEGIVVKDFTMGGIKVDGMPVYIDFAKRLRDSQSKIQKKIIELKEKVFNGNLAVVKFERERVNLFVDAIASQMQTTLEKSATAESEEIKKLIEAREEGRNIQIPFFWEFDFVDVMDGGGFDIVIANPPYVRQEVIYPEFFDPDELELLPVSKDKLKDTYKKAIIENTKKIVDSKISKRSDIYAYFFMKGVNILKECGTLVFITSNSWLDVDYGTWMQEEFLKKTHLRFVFDYPHRTFEEAAVKTIITVMEKKREKVLDPHTKIKFVKLKKNIGGLQYDDFAEILGDIDGGTEVNIFGARVRSVGGSTARYRIVDEVNLAKLGGATTPRVEQKGNNFIIPDYKGAKWSGLLIRAPEIFYTILRKGEGKLVRLGEIAEVKRGFTTGANEFFYLEPIKNPDDWPVCEICGRVHMPDEGLVAVKNKAGWVGYIEEECLKPVIVTPKNITKYFIHTDLLKYVVFMCNYSKNELKKCEKQHALGFILWGEKNRINLKSTLRSRSQWWSLNNRSSNILMKRPTSDIPFFYYSLKQVCHDQSFYSILPKSSVNPILLWGILNTTMVAGLFRELVSGASGPLGEGALWTAVYEAKQLFVLNVSHIHLNNVFEKTITQIGNREALSIFQELGLPKPNRDYSNIKPEDVTLDKIMPDRRELDKIIFEALGLTEEEQLEVYRAVVELVKERLVKAKSFGR